MDIRCNKVIDINDDTPRSSDVLFIDTNIWFWMTYDRYSLGDSEHQPMDYQIESYPDYIDAAIETGTKLYRSALSLSELAHLVEGFEHQIYVGVHGDITLKNYRRLYEQRTNVVEQIDLAWDQIKSFSTNLLNENIDTKLTEKALNSLKTQLLDGYDIFMVNFAIDSGVINIVTDDGDYASVEGINLFTANKNVIESAEIQGKLLTR